jgi:hypothetical protein
MAVARTSTRRDFLSMLARGIVGAGFGAGVLFGGRRHAFADATCRTVKLRGRCLTNDCENGDANGCLGSSYCATCPAPDDNRKCSPGYKFDGGTWTCCCSGMLTTCIDCVDPTGRPCLCRKPGGPCA